MGKKESNNKYGAILFILVAVGIVWTLMVSGNEKVSGQLVQNIPRNVVPTKCEYFDSADVQQYLNTNPLNPTGDNFCIRKQFQYAALIDNDQDLTLLDSTNGQCNGLAQVSYLNKDYTTKGSLNLYSPSSSCGTYTATTSTEPEYGDYYQGISTAGVLCCP